MHDCLRGRGVWGLWAVGGAISLCRGAITWEDQEMDRVHMGALELEGHKVNYTDSPRKVRGQ